MNTVLEIHMTPRHRWESFKKAFASPVGRRFEGGTLECKLDDNVVTENVLLHELEAAFTGRFRKEWSGDGYDWSMVSWTGDCLKLQSVPHELSASIVMDTLKTQDFLLAGLGPPRENWWGVGRFREFHMMERGHAPLGSFAAFSGEDGHAWLPSRRWLQHGPWLLHRDEEADISLIQFCDIEEEDEATAFDQAIPGLRWFSLTGGLIPKTFNYEGFEPAFFEAATGTSVILVNDREVTEAEMLRATAVKRNQPYPDTTIQQVAFVFTDEANARAHLQAMWLRGLEVRAFIKGAETRLDDVYAPPLPKAPNWCASVPRL